MRTWAEIDLDNLAYNIKKIKELSHDRDIMAIIKADAYGMGAVTIAKELSEQGVKIFGVSSLEEGIELRNFGIKEEILILAGTFNEELEVVEKYNLQVTLTDISQIEYILEKNMSLYVHIKVDTGMGRVGFTVDEAKKAIKICQDKGIEVRGIYSHLSVADESDKESIEYTKKQLERFKEFQNIENIKYIHILNSGGILNFSEITQSNLVRAGIIMYGVYGEGIIKELKRVFTLKSRILFLKELEEDIDISYGRVGKGHKGDLIATVTVGYADGFRRELSNKGTVDILGKPCEIVGKICMDMLMVRIPDEIREEVKIGDEVIVMGEDVFEKSKIIGSSIYELFTGLSRRVSRVYLKDGKPHVVNNLIGKV
ncbi:MAG: alanine racemase [Cetobacterium sp.]|uniref:alanine racemase n=1 Tax=Cetobacterium sp. TaxID=2071632 RepID=UPI002FC87B9D